MHDGAKISSEIERNRRALLAENPDMPHRTSTDTAKLVSKRCADSRRNRNVDAPTSSVGQLGMTGRAGCNASVAMIEPTFAEPPLSTLRPHQEQLTPELMDDLRRYAQGRANLVRRAGRPVSEAYARELVDDVHADVQVGDLPWDPRFKLLDQMKAAIKKRTWLEIRHARRVSFISLQEAANDEALPPEMAQALAPAPRTDCDPTMLHAVTATVCQQLRSLVSRDIEATAIVRCWADGFMDKDEVMRLTGLAEAAYEYGRKRLRSAIRCLTSELREAAQDLLRSAA